MKDLEVTPGWVIPSEDLEYRFAKSGGPGGQNVNKLSTKVELRFDLGETRALSPAQKRRLTARYPSHATGAAFIVSSDRFRSQARNRTDAAEKFAAMLLSIQNPPKPRVSTKPSRAAKRRRLEDKRRRSEIKRGRRGKDDQ